MELMLVEMVLTKSFEARLDLEDLKQGWTWRKRGDWPQYDS